MKTVSANLKTHLQGESLTICTLWKITRTDSVVFGFTDNSRDVVYSGVTYLAATGHTPSSIKTTSNLSVDNLEVQSVLDSSAITEADIQAGLWDFALVEIMIVNYLSLADGHMTLRKGWLGDIRTGRHNFIAELRGMMQPLQQSIGRIFAPSCDAILGDARCGVTLASYTSTGTVDTVTNKRQFTATGITSTTGYYDGGLVTWVTGDNAGYSMEIKTNVSLAVTLQLEMPNTIVIGDTFIIIPGCDKSLSTCKTKFNNVINFRGFPHVPGNDKLFAGE